MNTKVTASAAWAAIEAMFVAQSRARVIATRMALATAKKGSSTVSEYYSKMKALADEMASAGKKIEDEELVSYILTGLDEPLIRWSPQWQRGLSRSRLVICSLS